MENTEIILKDILITDLGNDGEGIGTLPSGKKVFVNDALIGEVCDAKIISEEKRYTKAVATEIKTASPDRVLPLGSHIPGANLAHLSYEAQLKYKTSKVKNCLLRIGNISIEDINSIMKDTLPSNKTTGYRNHMQYKLNDGKLCLMSYHSNNPVPIEKSELEYEIFGVIRKTIENIFENAPTYLFSEVILRGSERTSEVMLEFVSDLNDSHEIIIRDCSDYLEATSAIEKISNAIKPYKLTGITLRISTLGHEKRTRIGKRVTLFGEDFYTEKLCGKTFRIKAGAFFQVNIEGAEKLYSLASEGISDASYFCDFYCGTGSIGLSVIRDGQTLIGVESVSEAIDSAKLNAKLSGVENAKFFCRPAEKFDFKKEKLPIPEAVIVDPPRKGMHPQFVNYLIKLAPSKISYISCDPATLARDLKPLIEAGYKIISCQPVDMFPNCSHVETVCLLSQLSEAPKMEMRVKLTEFDLTEAEAKATYSDIKEYVKEHTGLKVSSLYIAQVKQKYGIIERDCYNLPKSDDSRQPKCPEHKEKAIVEALKYFKMI